MYALARSLLFRLEAERAHEWTLALLERLPALAGLMAAQVPDHPVEFVGLKLRNPVGLAAGLDKNGRCLEAWAKLGFGFVEVGTVTPRPQPGNPRPRMFRLPAKRALINRLGFNNEGVDALVARLQAYRFPGVLGINIGKNADTPIEQAADDYLICLRKVYAHADYITVNISSPNTKNLRALQDEQMLDALLGSLMSERETLAGQSGRRVPLLVKIAPDLDQEQLDGIARSVRKHGIDGLIATNTTLSRSGVDGEPQAGEAGGLSGAPLLFRANDTLRELRSRLGPDYPIVGVGGILDGGDARRKFEIGAQVVQVYSGFIYRGPVLIREAAQAAIEVELDVPSPCVRVCSWNEGVCIGCGRSLAEIGEWPRAGRERKLEIRQEAAKRRSIMAQASSSSTST